ncbi:glycosyltransferase family 2 protein [Zavarzinia sp. CC-PAN008]|uniref:glycosyltransferase family 2 protein n=1 Tax=Zavarzinia sp. CC-PAN008 TaxID=3243332 RepID=UPI003F746922
MSAPRLSALVVAHNEEAELPGCLARLSFADEVVVVLDRCTDRSAEIARASGARVIEGGWEIEGARRNTGIEACSGHWIVEVDADERMPHALATEIREVIATSAPGWYLIPFDNYIGRRLVRHGWGAGIGVSAAPRLFARGHKTWGAQRIHPKLELGTALGSLRTPMEHYVDRDLSDMLARLDRYTTARARDLVDSGDIGTLGHNVRRMFSRFWKCYVARKGYREGPYGVLVALMAALYPVLSHLKARFALDEAALGRGDPP